MIRLRGEKSEVGTAWVYGGFLNQGGTSEHPKFHNFSVQNMYSTVLKHIDVWGSPMLRHSFNDGVLFFMNIEYMIDRYMLGG